jgi:predicted dehydrogenase
MTRIGVIGCGHWGPNHIRNFNSLPNCWVEAVADLDEGRLRYVSEAFPGVRRERDHRRLLSDPAIDAVVVATPVSTHYEMVREAILAGKHVLCEKPLCKNEEQARELVDLAHEKDRCLMVGHVFLFNPGIAKLKELVDSGELGNLQYLAATRTNLGIFQKDANVAYDLATHDISIFNWLLDDEPEVVSATGASFVRSGIEDVVFISMKYPGNVLANIHVSWIDPKKVRQITAVGSRQMVTWDDLELTSPIAIYDKGANAIQDHSDFGEFLRLSTWDRDIRLPKVRFDEPLKLQATEFLRYLENGRVERSEGEFGLEVTRVLEAVAASMELGGSPVEVGRREYAHVSNGHGENGEQIGMTESARR